MNTEKSDENSRAELFVQNNYSDMEFITRFLALALNIDIAGLTLKEANNKCIQALENVDEINIIQKFLDSVNSDSERQMLLETLIQSTKKLATNIHAYMAEKEKSIVSVRSTKATKHVSETDRVTQQLFDTGLNPVFYKTGKEVRTSRKNAKKEAYIAVKLNTDKLKDAIQKRNIILSNDDIILNPFTRAVHDAAVSLYLSNDEPYITEEMIYREMTGYGRKDNAQDSTLEKIHAELEKLMYTHIHIDNTAEANAWNIENFEYKGYVLPAVWACVTINGKKCSGWKILEKPPLLSMAEKKNQINRCDIKLLDTELNATPDNIVLRNYLLEQIQAMKNKKSNRNTTILYKTIYEFLHVDAPTKATLRVKKIRIREKVKKILDKWIKNEFIQGYKEIIEGREIIGLSINLR